MYILLSGTFPFDEDNLLDQVTRVKLGRPVLGGVDVLTSLILICRD